MRLEEAGVVWTSRKTCRPLDEIEIEFVWDGLVGQDVRFEVSDADHHVYCVKRVKSDGGVARAVATAGGKAGVQHITAYTTGDGGSEYARHGGFRLECATSVVTNRDDLNQLYGQIEEGLKQSVDVTVVDGRRVTHFKHADNTRENIAYPVWPMNALRYYLADVQSVHEVHYEYQYPNGSLPDHIYSDNYPCPLTSRRLRSCMGDLEVGAGSTLYRAWQAHGDDAWMSRMLPRLEAALEYVLSDPGTYDVEHGVIKRPHTLDEWDINFSASGEQGCFITDDTVYVIMQGDTSSLHETACCLAEVYKHLGREDRASRWAMMARHFKKLGNELFWDGRKYLHHIHLDPFDHGDFDERDQLSMSSAFAINRGFADHEQAVSIIKEYLRRAETTGDRFPWWSLQPGYPDELGYFKDKPRCERGQGNYANGGLFPWVGAELCRGAFRHGMEDVAVGLLKDLQYVLQRDHGALFTWYDLQGNAAINAAHNQTNYDAFGFFAWVQAYVEELAGIQSVGKCFEKVMCCPRWPVTGAHEAWAVANFPASETYFAYRYTVNDDTITLIYTGTGSEVDFRILLPSQRTCRGVQIDGEEVAFESHTIEASNYVVVSSEIGGTRRLECTLEGAG